MNAMRWIAIVASLVAALGFAGVGTAEERMKHSGTIVAIDDAAGTILLAEIGPWKVRGGKTVMTYRTITVTPDTEFSIVGREYATIEGWPGEFLEGVLPPGAVYVDDYVTVDCVHKGARQIALKVTVTEVGEP
jgi:hypothetical protein